MRPIRTALASAVLAVAASAQIQVDKLLAYDGYQQQNFGSAVASDQGWVIVGVLRDSQFGSAAGAAYSYRRNGATYDFTQKFAGNDTGEADNFGWSVDIDGATSVVGASSDFPNGVFGAGSAYVFERTGATWIQTQKLVASPTIPNATFGWAVALDGNRMLVSARSENTAFFNAGAVYVFERVAGVWSQTARLVPSDGSAFDFFGMSVALHGDTAMIGSAADGPTGSQAGAAYVFEFNGVQWTQVAKLRATDPFLGDGVFSGAVALGSGFALAGSSGHKHAGIVQSGAVYAFERIGGVWQPTQELLSHTPVHSAMFGYDVSISGEFALIGSFGEPTPVFRLGAGYLFRRSAMGWTEVARLTANDPVAEDLFGGPAALDGNTAVVGVQGRDDLCPTLINCASGAVYTIDLALDARQFGWCVSGAPCGNHDKYAGCANATTSGATLGAAGSSSVVLDELRFELRRMQPFKSAVVFMGNAAGQIALGDGLRSVASAGAGFYRFSVLQSGADGAAQLASIASRSLSFPASGQIQPGAVWSFQGWYRDPAGPCGSGTNLTNALEVTFRP